MKKYILLIVAISLSVSAQSQKIKQIDEFNFSTATKKDYKSYKQGFEVENFL